MAFTLSDWSTPCFCWASAATFSPSSWSRRSVSASFFTSSRWSNPPCWSATSHGFPFSTPNRCWRLWPWWSSSFSSLATAPLRPGIVIFPIVFLLTFTSAVGQQPVTFASPTLRSSWIFVHVVMIFTGYAGLFLSFGASLLYLMQERALKAKSVDGLLSKLPSLETIDDIGYKSLLFGFPFMTFGLIAGSVLAIEKYGPLFFTDPKILLSFIMWIVYMLLLYTRWNSGWRGRRAAMLATCAFVIALGVWAANSFSRVHRFPSL